MRKILVVVDMQKDFVDGALGTPEAEAIVSAVAKKIQEYPIEDVYVTMDTHEPNYLQTQEGKYLPVEHCIRGTDGWELDAHLEDLLKGATVFEKPTFGSINLANALLESSKEEELSIELVGLCTDICVVSNALLLKAMMPEVSISVDPSCCAGVTPKRHEEALETMAACQIQFSK